ncbi:phosphatidylinositol/phosphatidylcholine transfer protein SFH8 isoform X1 [Tripterygium wilfordii]|uniref:Phosphatidylinositol/phosphatidylcholine transfer protein SFH8 isoform X1 n=1 Tax=Tripterygium wilfordii TaxID=458696 RepID=A0A7J7DE68_TRIWF|nr:uncharacterized protein LOC120002094 [Tripterygium wilfordii]XP_038706609.1 uncharacterized protein LOC120002094 [Tripterygium wilfordii]XP_038706610.1 uncharacterized protein LOC120002094 [Tripterygium wilfordii]KAF5744622.1 phosphatidylinositol/phosphatidylcholine transfer protein SFH8 isoform X1 [Tripterygium wilfordii]
MGDPLRASGPSWNSKLSSVTSRKEVLNRSLVASTPKGLSGRASRHIASLRQGRTGWGAAADIAVFLLKVAALETVRRVSRSTCPFVWSSIQALQVLCYPPFKWIQRWAPFKGLIGRIQIFSRPLLVISIATAFSDQSACNVETSNGSDSSHAHSETGAEPPQVPSMLDTRSPDAALERPASETWMIQLHKDLKSQGISLPERIDEDELVRFHKAANGDYSVLLAAIKKTIRWRQTYQILSEQELETWSNMIFWHGVDLIQRPCLIVRLGLACSRLPSHDRPRFAQAVISQVEHGVLHLVNLDNPHITVLVDCEGLSPLRIPMQMMRSCSSLLQHHFPNRLGYLFVIRLPPMVQVIAQTFFQSLKPTTRKKLKIEGDIYHRVLSEYLPTLPSYLGGNCICLRCSDIRLRGMQQPHTNERNGIESDAYLSDDEDLQSPHLFYEPDIPTVSNFDCVFRTAVIGILMMWVFIALISGLNDPESRPF